MQVVLGESCHALGVDELAQVLGTDLERGLDRFELERRQARFGPNALTARHGPGPLRRFVAQFHQPLVYILLAAAGVTGALGEWVDATVILLVVLLNAIVGFIQEGKALSAIDALSRALPANANVLRAGVKQLVPAATLVPGDVVLLQSGDRVPADLRLLRVRDLRVDESALTGESVPVTKGTESLEATTAVSDRRNMAYSSSFVTYGTAAGVVVAVGSKTELGKISEMIAAADALETPLTRRIQTFSRFLLLAILALAGVSFGVAMWRDYTAVDALMAAVALAVGAIPEGLPAAVTVILAIGVSRMATRRAIVRRLPAVEALGSTTIICSDKTGTLTENQMTVTAIAAGGHRYAVTGTGYAPKGAIERNGKPINLVEEPALASCLRAGASCNEAELFEEEEIWRVRGDPTEAALLAASSKGGIPWTEVRAQSPAVDTVPFESEHQYMATLHRRDDEATVAYVKGSAEALLTRASHMADASGRPAPLDERAIRDTVDALAGEGQRVLALAEKTFSADKTALTHDDLRADLVILGLQAMIDPPREEAARAIAVCGHAGVGVKMITGDHVGTARAIAAKLGIGTPRGGALPPALTGQQLEVMSDTDLIEAVEGTSVFARVTPQHKLRLVNALRTRGEVVAMTGDGVNDAPALRAADIGVAMGQGGSEAARDASDMVLTDDNFATIEAAVEEGRAVFENLLKFIVWTLPTNAGEGLVVLLAVLTGVAIPMLPVHILWINMTTAGALGMVLAFEPKEAGLMDRPPRAPSAPILDRELLVRIGIVSVLLCAGSYALFLWELRAGAPEVQARSVAATVFVIGEMFYLFNCRSLSRSMLAIGVMSNPFVWLGVGAMLALQGAFLYLPVMNRLFETAAITAEQWAKIVVVGVLIYLVVGAEKWMKRTWDRWANKRER